jgi:hypothetical protein
MKDLVLFWLAKGANLALAEPFVAQCADSISQLFTSHDDKWHLVYAQRLLQNSARLLQFDASSDLESFSAQFLDHNARWETLGIFFAAVSRATIDIPFFPLLYNTEEQQYMLRRLATKLSDFSLEISLSLDCLNDLQLMVQYENFIVHSYVDGDQSEFQFLVDSKVDPRCHFHQLILSRLSHLAQAWRCNFIHLRPGISRESRSEAWNPSFSHGIEKNGFCPDLFCGQEYRHLPWPPTTHEQTLLPLPDSI